MDWIVPHPAGSSWVFSESLDTLPFVFFFFGRVAKSIKIGSGDLEPAFHIHTGITRTQPPFSVPVPSGEIAAPFLMIKTVSHIGCGPPRAGPLGFASVHAYLLGLKYRVLDSLTKQNYQFQLFEALISQLKLGTISENMKNNC